MTPFSTSVQCYQTLSVCVGIVSRELTNDQGKYPFSLFELKQTVYSNILVQILAFGLTLLRFNLLDELS